MSLSAVALRRPSAIFHEEQWFNWWVYAGLGLVSMLAGIVLFDRTIGWSTPWAFLQTRPFQAIALAGVVAPQALVVGALRMVTRVTPGELRVTFGFVPTYRRIVPTAAIARIEVVQYHPVRDYVGWGIRFGRRGQRIYNARGNRGVALHLRDGSHLLVGSQRPEELALALEASRPTHH